MQVQQHGLMYDKQELIPAYVFLWRSIILQFQQQQKINNFEQKCIVTWWEETLVPGNWFLFHLFFCSLNSFCKREGEKMYIIQNVCLVPYNIWKLICSFQKFTTLMRSVASEVWHLLSFIVFILFLLNQKRGNLTLRFQSCPVWCGSMLFLNCKVWIVWIL